MDSDLIIIISMFILGSLLGSFANACVYRIKFNKSIVFDRSECTNCHKKLSFFELIPVFSYLIQFGRCRNCKKIISPHYLLVEIFFALFLSTLSSLLLLNDPQVLLFTMYSVFSLAILIIIVSDLLYLEIPDEMHFITISISLISILLLSNPIAFSILSGLFASIFFFIIFKYSGENKMGFGDVKLVFALGIIFGLFQFLFIVIFSSLLGIIYGVGLSAITKQKIREIKVPLGSMIGLVSLGLILFSLTEFGSSFLVRYNFYSLF